jgi:hypothetical protein
MFPSPKSQQKRPVAAALEQRLSDRLERELGPDWTVLRDCELDDGGEGMTADYVVIHRAFGIAVIAFGRPGEAGRAERAAAAMRARLEEIGFTRRFPGGLTVVAQSLDGDEPGDLVERLFTGQQRCAIADPTWPEWLVHRLVPAPTAGHETAPTPPAAAPVRLRAPSREEAWRVSAAPPRGEAAAAAGSTGVAAPDRPIAAVSQSPRTKRTWWIDMGLAFVVVSVVLVGMALLSHGNGPARPPAAISGSSSQ